jgi:hypothetical protein
LSTVRVFHSIAVDEDSPINSNPVYTLAAKIGTSVQGLLRNDPRKIAKKFNRNAQAQNTTLAVWKK